jgi:hypothetical protein
MGMSPIKEAAIKSQPHIISTILLVLLLSACASIQDIICKPAADTSSPLTAASLPTTAVLNTPEPADCSNPLWPVSMDAAWVYQVTSLDGQSLGTETWQVTSLTQGVDGTAFTVHVTSSDGESDSQYLCMDGAIFDPAGNILLPPVGSLVPEFPVLRQSGESLVYTGASQVLTPAGTFSAHGFIVLPGGTMDTYWSEGVGLVQVNSGTSMILESFTLP